MHDIRRSAGGYALLEKNNEDSLRFWLDNGEDVTECFDITERHRLMEMSDDEFINECKKYFKQ